MFSNVTLVGHLGRDPELKKTQSGVDVCQFSMAVKREYAKDGDVDTDWHDVVLFGQPATYAGQYLRKGALVVVEGSLQVDQWEKDGVRRSKHKIKGKGVKSVKRPEGETQAAPAPIEATAAPRGPVPRSEVDMSNIPF